MSCVSKQKDFVTNGIEAAVSKHASKQHFRTCQLSLSLKLPLVFAQTDLGSLYPNQTPKNMVSDQGLHCLPLCRELFKSYHKYYKE